MVSRWRSGGRVPDANDLVALLGLAGVSADYVLGLPAAAGVVAEGRPQYTVVGPPEAEAAAMLPPTQGGEDMAAAETLERIESVLRQMQDSQRAAQQVQQATQDAQSKAQADLVVLVGHLVKLTAANQPALHADAVPQTTPTRPEKSKSRGAARA